MTRIIEIDEAINPADLERGLDITPDHCEAKYALVRDSLVITHPFYSIIVCADCGKVRGGVVTPTYEMSQQEAEWVTVWIVELPQCLCWQIHDGAMTINEAREVLRRDIKREVERAMQHWVEQLRIQTGFRYVGEEQSHGSASI